MAKHLLTQCIAVDNRLGIVIIEGRDLEREWVFLFQRDKGIGPGGRITINDPRCIMIDLPPGRMTMPFRQAKVVLERDEITPRTVCLKLLEFGRERIVVHRNVRLDLYGDAGNLIKTSLRR